MFAQEESGFGVMQFEHIDWNDIVDAEMSGDSKSLLYLKNKSKHLKRCKSVDKQLKSNERSLPSLSPLSYAQVVGPEQQGMKRTTSERLGLSPVDSCPKRSAFSSRKRGQLSHTPPSQTLCSPDQNTPEGTPAECDTTKGNSGAVQRRLFSSPMADNQARATALRNSPGQVEELTSHRLQQRQKQIDFGKNTIGYQKFIQTKPKWERNPSDPMTPDKQKAVSTRAWQGQIRLWRRALHAHDPPTTEDSFTPSEAALCEMPPV